MNWKAVDILTLTLASEQDVGGITRKLAFPKAVISQRNVGWYQWDFSLDFETQL